MTTSWFVWRRLWLAQGHPCSVSTTCTDRWKPRNGSTAGARARHCGTKAISGLVRAERVEVYRGVIEFRGRA